MASTLSFPRSKGINNTSDPLSLGLAWRMRLDNMDVDDGGHEAVREGKTQAVTFSERIVSSHAPVTFQREKLRAYAGSTLYSVDVKNGVKHPLIAGLSEKTRACWAELNEQVYFCNGPDAYRIDADDSVHALRWPVIPSAVLSTTSGKLDAGVYNVCFTLRFPDGRETGPGEFVEIITDGTQAINISGIPSLAGFDTIVYITPANATMPMRAAINPGASMSWNSGPASLGSELTTFGLDPLPSGTSKLAAWQGSIYAAQYYPEHNQSAVFQSEPMGTHLFDYEARFFLVPGEITALGSVASNLVVCTHTDLYAWDGEKLAKIALFGASHAPYLPMNSEQNIFILTYRGLYSAMPLTPVNTSMSAQVGQSHVGSFIERDGGYKYLACVETGGQPAFNTITDPQL